MNTPDVLDLSVPSLLEPTIELYGELLDDEAEEVLQQLLNAITNFRIEPSEHGEGSSVWCDAYSRVDAVETRSGDTIERDNLVLELIEMQFNAKTIPTKWAPPWQGKAPAQTLDVCCAIENPDYELGITLQLGSAKFSLWPKGWRTAGFATWAPVEVTRHFRNRATRSDRNMFAVVRSIASMARNNQPVQVLLNLAQTVSIPDWVLNGDDSLPSNEGRSRGHSSSSSACRPVANEDPTALELRKNLTIEKAKAFVERLGRAVTNFWVSGDNGYDLSIRGDVIADLATWDCRTLDQKCRDMVIDNLRCHGLTAEIPEGQFVAADRSVYVELLEPGSRVPLFAVSDCSVGCAGRHPTTDKAVWLRFPIGAFPGGAPAAYGFLGLVAEARLKGEPIEDLLMHYQPTVMPLHAPLDDDPWSDAVLPSDVFGGGYVGDGLWLTGSGIQDHGR